MTEPCVVVDVRPRIANVDVSNDEPNQLSTFNAEYTRSGGTVIIPTGTELSVVTFTSDVSITATTEATANTIVTAGAIDFDGSTTVMIEMWAPSARPDLASNAILFVYLYDGTSIGRIATIAQPTYTPSSAVGVLVPLYARHRIAPSSGSHTFSIRARVSGGTGVVGAGAGGNAAVMPGHIRIYKT